MQVQHIPLKFRLGAVGGVVLIAAALFFVLSPRPAPRPNIILISLDTLRADRLGCYGCPTETSPNIDAFSRDSVQFMQVISQAPSTAGSHMSLFTGLLPPIHRVSNRMIDPETCRRLKLGLAPSIPTLALYLKENGYLTGGFHGGGFVSAVLGFDRGFDIYQKTQWEKLYSNPAPLKKVAKWLGRKSSRQKPFFLFIHNYICHDPYLQAPPDFRRRFLTAPVAGLQEKLEAIAPEGMKATRGFNSIRRSWWNLIDAGNEAHRRHVRDLYDAGVNYADFVFGKIIDSLKKKGLYDRSIIILLSDHGEQFWEHGGTGHGGWLFIETLHVPLLIKFPDGKYGGKKIATPVGLYDLMPMLLDFLRIKPRLKPQAESVLPLIQGKSADIPPLISFHESLETLRIESDNFAYSNRPSCDQREWLLDRRRDPGEQHNLAASNMPLLRQMRALAARILREQKALRAQIRIGAANLGKLPQEMQKQLKALGYL